MISDSSRISDGSRRTRTIIIAAGVTGSAVALLAVGRSWVVVRVADVGFPATVTTVTGRDIAPVVVGLAVAAVATSGTLALARPVMARILGILLGGCGAGSIVAVANSAARVADGRAIPSEIAARSVGRTGAVVTPLPGGSGWPWVAILGGVVITAAGVATLRRARLWSAGSGRYVRTPAAGSPMVTTSTHELWDALNRGDDPTYWSDDPRGGTRSPHDRKP
jgi:uncharacterized membrane protein (TIGR02234 family)